MSIRRVKLSKIRFKTDVDTNKEVLCNDDYSRS